MNKLEEQLSQSLAKEIEKHPEMNKTILDNITEAKNDAVRIARIAQNLYPLNMGFFTLLYDHLIFEELASGPFVDTEGKTREIFIDENATEAARVEGNDLYLSEAFWAGQDLQAAELKDILGRWFLGLHVKTDAKLSKKHSKAIFTRLSVELTAFSNLVNNAFYEFSDDKLKALALTIVDLAYDNIIRLCPNYCTEEQYALMYEFACKAIFDTMDTPSERPLIRAFNSAAPNALFLDHRAADLRRVFTGIQAQAADNKALQETLPLDYMAHCMELVEF